MSGTTPTELLAQRYHSAGLWRPVMPLLAGILLGTLLCFRDTFMAMVEIWARSETFTHGFVVPPLAGWMIWRQREQLARLAPRPEPWMLLPIVVIGFGWLLGNLASVNAVTQLAVTAILVMTIVTVVGVRIARVLAFPLAFLFFAVPIGEFVMPRLMEWTADFTVLALRLTGIPVYREGLSFVIPSGNWSVVEACSGVRYLIASLMVGTLFAYLNYRSLQRRLVFVVVSIVVPVFANWLRAYMIVMLGHVSGNTLAVGVDHLIYGWLFFGVVIMLMFYIGARWSEEEAPLPAFAQTSAAGSAGPASKQRVWVVAALSLPAIAWPLVANWAVEHSDVTVPPVLTLPASETMGGWQRISQAEADIVPAYENPPATAEAMFAKDGRTIGLYVAYYRNQGYGQKLVTSTNTLIRSKDPRWTVVGQGSHALVAADGATRVRTYDLVPGLTSAAVGREHLAVWQWYWINGHLTASDAEAKIYTAWSRLKGDGDDSAVVFIYARQPDIGAAEAALTAFVAEAGPAVNAMLRQTRSQR